jgi:hypothetical protein
MGLRPTFQLLSWRGVFHKVRVVEVKKSMNKAGVLAFIGRSRQLPNIDPLLSKWRNGSPFFHYSTKIGRELLNARTSLKKPIAEKWRGDLTINFSRDWKESWKKDRASKEGGFMWSIWHQTVATNSWRGKFNLLGLYGRFASVL